MRRLADVENHWMNHHDNSSRRRYEAFRKLFRNRSLDALGSSDTEKDNLKRPEKAARRRYLRDYINWLRPHLGPLLWLFATAALVAGLDMAHPLFMRYIIDHVLMAQGVPDVDRLN